MHSKNGSAALLVVGEVQASTFVLYDGSTEAARLGTIAPSVPALLFRHNGAGDPGDSYIAWTDVPQPGGVSTDYVALSGPQNPLLDAGAPFLALHGDTLGEAEWWDLRSLGTVGIGNDAHVKGYTDTTGAAYVDIGAAGSAGAFSGLSLNTLGTGEATLGATGAANVNGSSVSLDAQPGSGIANGALRSLNTGGLEKASARTFYNNTTRTGQVRIRHNHGAGAPLTGLVETADGVNFRSLKPQRGTFTIAMTGTPSAGSAAVNFPQAFSVAPTVMLTAVAITGSQPVAVNLTGAPTAAGFGAIARAATDTVAYTGNITVHYLAFETL